MATICSSLCGKEKVGIIRFEPCEISMANEDHEALLRAGVAAWNEWRASSKTLLPDLTGVDFSGLDLQGANLSGVDFLRSNLSNAKLQNTDLGSANLMETNLSSAQLDRADLVGAQLIRADLTGANLMRADFLGANLHNASLRKADLTGTNLSGIDFSRANLAEAELFETIFSDLDLTEVAGLDHCFHSGPSLVDHRTLERSKNVPINFWQGCGLPEALIEYLPSLLNQAIQFYSCFISYSREDKSFARRLHDQLQGQGIRCWLDEHQILPGDNIAKEIDTGIRARDKVLLCCSEHSLNSAWVNREMEKALQKEEQLWKKRGCETLAIIPINLDGALFQWDGHWKSEIVKRHAPDFTDWEQDNTKFEAEFERVVKALRADQGARQKPPMAKL